MGPAPSQFYTLSLHDALPISVATGGLEVKIIQRVAGRMALGNVQRHEVVELVLDLRPGRDGESHSPEQLDQFVHDLQDRKSTRLNSSHRCISYAVFCLKKKKT